MVQGFERREGVQDQNPQKAMQADSVALSTVMYPRHASMEGVGKNWEDVAALTDVLKKPLENFVTKYRDQSIVDGELMYAQGKAEQEVAETGNAYTMQGFKTLQAKTESNTWFNNKMAAIDDGDNQLDPTEYRRQLSAELQPMLESVSSADDSIKHFVVQNSVEHMTKLVDQQVRSHNKWKETQTVLAGTQLVGSSAALIDPKDTDGSLKIRRVQESIQVATDGHTPEVKRQIVGNSLQLAAQQGDISVRDAYLKDHGFTTEGTPDLAYAVMMVESGGRRYDKDGNLLKSESGALGEMQILPSTALKPAYGVKPAKDLSPEELARTAKDYLNAMHTKYNNTVLAVMAYNAGPDDVDKHLAKGDPRTNPSVSWDSFVSTFINSQGKDPKQTQKYLEKIKPYLESKGTAKSAAKHAAFVGALMRDGYSPSEVASISNSYERLYKDKANAFSEKRLQAEQDILTAVSTDGNYAEGLKRIRETKDALDLTDEWANSMANQLEPAVRKQQKEALRLDTVKAAITGGTLSTLSGSDQELGVQLQQSKDAGEVEALITSGQLKQEAAPAEMFKRSVQFAHKQGVVNKTIAAEIHAGAAAPLFESNGEVSKNARQAFQKYLSVYQLGGKEYADKYAGDSKEFLDLARQYSTGANLDTALLAAREVQAKYADKNIKQPTVSDQEVQTFAESFMKDFDADYFIGRAFSTPNALGAAQVYDWEIENATNDARLQSFIKQQYLNQRRLGVPEYKAQENVKDVVNKQVDFIMGQPIITSPGKTIADVAGIQPGERNALNKMVQVTLQEVGPKYWKEDWDKFQILGTASPDAELLDAGSAVGAGVGAIGGGLLGTAGGPAGIAVGGAVGASIGATMTGGKGRAAIIGAPGAITASIADWHRGVPDCHIQHDEANGTLIIRPYANKERTSWIDKPLVLSIKGLGDKWQAFKKPKSQGVWDSIASGTSATFSAIGGKF